MTLAIGLTRSVFVTGAAARKFASPAWVACKVQLPTATPRTVVPLTTTQTAGVLLVKVTGSAELAVTGTARSLPTKSTTELNEIV